MIQKIRLLTRECTGSPGISLIVFLTTALSVLCFSVFLAAGSNINRYIDTKFARAIPPNIIRVAPKTTPALSLFGFSMKKNQTGILNETALAKIRSLAGVSEVYPLMASQIPMQATISIFGLNYRTDLVCIGAPYSYVYEDIPDALNKQLWKTWKPGRELPVMIPEILLDAYNNSMAEPNGLPRITKDFAAGKTLQILFGKSSIKSIDGFSSERATVTGFTSKIASLCLVIPLPAMVYYNTKLSKGTDSGYMSAFLRVSDHAAVPGIVNQLKKSGLIVETDKTLSEEILSLKNNANLAIRFLSLVILFLAAVATVFSAMISVFGRIENYRILRLLGASKLFIGFSVLLKYALIGLGAAFLALILMDQAGNFMGRAFSFPGFAINWKLDSTLKNRILITGTLLPMLSTLPGLIRLFTRGLTSD